MQELISVNTNKNGVQVVSARELHKGLKIESNFSTWMHRMIEYGFEEGTDFFPFLEESNGGRPKTDYVLTLDMGKEICMIQRNELGRMYRKYFIECENKLRELYVPSYQIQDPIERAKKWIEEEKVRQFQAKQLEEQKPLVEFADHVSKSVNSIDMGTFAKLLYDEHIHIGRNKLFQWMKDHKYLMYNKVPYQQYIDSNYFEVIEQTYKTPYGDKRIATKTLVTGKGQIYFTEKLRKEFSKS